MKCASWPPLLSATSALCRQLVAKLSGITEWYKKRYNYRSHNPYAAGFTDQKLYVRQIGVKWYYGRVQYCVLLKFQFACKSRLWNVANSTSYCTKTHHFGMEISNIFCGGGIALSPDPSRWGGGHPLPTPYSPRRLRRLGIRRLRRFDSCAFGARRSHTYLFFYKLTTEWIRGKLIFI